MRIPCAVVVLFVACSAVSAAGVEAGTPTAVAAGQAGMSLSDLEAIAEQNNPTLAQAAARIRAARAECLQAGLYPNPRVAYQANEINDERQAGQQGAFLGQEFVTAGKLKRNQAVAAREVEQAEFIWQAQHQRVLNDVHRAYYEVLIAQRNIELTDELVRIGQEGVRSAEALLQAQEVSRVDVLQARIESDSARLLAEKAHNRYVATWRNLAVVVGDADIPPAALTGNLEDGATEFTWEATVSQMLSGSPQLAAARANVSRAEAVVSREYAARIPNVDLQAGVAYDNATRDTIAQVQTELALPLFNRNQGNIRKAEAELTSARHEVRRVELELRQRMAAVFEQYQNARCQVDRYAKDILPNAESSLHLVATGYRHGEFNYLTLLTAQRTFFQAKLAYVDAMRDLRSAVVVLEGYLLSDSLQQSY